MSRQDTSKDASFDRRTGRRRGRLLWLGLILVALGFMPCRGLSQAEEGEESWFDKYLSGSLRTVYRYRSSDGEEDSDLYEYFYLRGHDLVGGHMDIYTSGRFHWDLDGDAGSLGDEIFASIEDTSTYSEEQLYQLHVDLHDKNKRYRLRAGRQYIDVADSLHLDGGQLSIHETARLGGRVFFGQPVSFYSSVSGDWAGGFSIVGRPWEGNRTRLTCTWYVDDSEDVTDELYLLDSRQMWKDAFRSRVRVTAFDNDFQMAGLDLNYLPPDKDFDCAAGVHVWDSFTAKSRAYSPLYRVLGNLNPYTYAYARMSMALTSWLRVSPGASARLVDSADRDSQNRNYRHGDLTFTLEPTDYLDISVAGEYWDVDERDSFFGVSGEIRYRKKRAWELAAGAAYVDYEYEQFTDFSYSANGGETQISQDGTRITVSPDAYTYYLRGKVNITRLISLRARGEIEDNSLLDELSYSGRLSSVIRF